MNAREDAPAQRSELVGYGSVLSNRRFALLWSGQTISWLGDSVYLIALLWLVQDLTGSRAMMGLVAACRSLPSLMGFLAGALVDRSDRRRIMISADLTRGLIVMAVPLLASLGLLRAWQLPLVAACLGLVAVFFVPARQALLPALVDGEDLVSANALMTISMQLVHAVGFAAGGLLISVVGILPLFMINAATFGVSALNIYLLDPGSRYTARNAADIRGTIGAGRSRLAAELRTGILFVVRHPALSRLVPWILAMNFFIVPLFVLLPSLARDQLGGDAATYGFLQTAHMLGMVCGALLVAQFARRSRGATALLSMLTVQGLALVGLAISRSVPAAIAAMAAFGLLDSIVVITFTSHFQRIIPRGMMGRVFGAFETFTQILVPAGQAIGGIAGQVLPLTVVFGAVGALRLAGTGAAWILPGLRRAVASVGNREGHLQPTLADGPDLADRRDVTVDRRKTTAAVNG